jgi:hypothetical protein
VSELQAALQHAEYMPIVEMPSTEDLDLEELDHIYPDTWGNISTVITDTIQTLIEKVSMTRKEIEPVRTYGINANQLLLRNVIAVHEVAGQAL